MMLQNEDLDHDRLKSFSMRSRKLSDFSSGTKSTTKDSRGYLICLTATAVWSFTAILIRYLTDTYLLPPLVLAFWRDAFVFAALATVFLIFNRTNFHPAGRNLEFMVLYGFILSSIALRRTGVRIPSGPLSCPHMWGILFSSNLQVGVTFRCNSLMTKIGCNRVLLGAID